MSGRFKYTANKLTKEFSNKLGVEIDKDDFSTFINNAFLEPRVRQWEEAGRYAMHEIRCGAMCTFISNRKNGRYIAYYKAIRFKKSGVEQTSDGKIIRITINSYVDTDVFSNVFAQVSTAYENIYEWRSRTRSYDDPTRLIGHESDGWYGTIYDGSKPTNEHFRGSAIAMPYSIGEYVLHNMWDNGYTALPPKETATGTNWENKKPNVKTPLKDSTEKSLLSKWGTTVNAVYNKNKLSKELSNIDE